MIRNVLKWTSGNGVVDSYSVYRSTTPIDVNLLPAPIATGITSNTYTDIDVVPGGVYFYRVSSIKEPFKRLSDELKVLTISPMPELTQTTIHPYAFWLLNETEGSFLDTSGNNRHLVSSPTAIRGLDPIDQLAELCAAANNIAASEKRIGLYQGVNAISNNFTLSCFISIPNVNTQTGGEFFKLGSGGTGFSVGFNNGTPGGPNGRYLQIGQNAISFRPTTYRFSDDAQQAHIAIRWSGGLLSVFVNGAKVYQQSVGNYRPSLDVFQVGAGELPLDFKMPMSRVAVYDAALTDDDIILISQALTGSIQR